MRYSWIHFLILLLTSCETSGKLLNLSEPVLLLLFSHSVVSDSCDRMDYSPPSSSVHGIFQARILGWVAISFFTESVYPFEKRKIIYLLPKWLKELR